MSHEEVFSDPLVVVGPNPRSLSTDTEQVEEEVPELVEDPDDG